MEGLKRHVTVDEIKTCYFGENRRRRLEEADVPATSSARSADLTPSAKFVAAEARKRIGQRAALADQSGLSEDGLFRLVRSIEEVQGEQLSERERTSVVAALSSSLDHYDILQALIENAEINDIIIRSYDDISIQIGRRNIQTDLRFADKPTYVSFVENLLKRVGKACTLATPVVDAAVDAAVRICVTHDSFSPPGSGPMVTLRIARHTGSTVEGLIAHQLAPRVVLDYLAALVRSGAATVLIAGEVGTGKTTLVKALAGCIDEEEAVLIIEDTYELSLPRRFARTLLTREANTEGAGRISPAHAIRTGMRMAMNRVILGEMRDAEAAEAFLDVCASGHPGMSTIHARNGRDALARLELFLSRAQPGVSIESVRRQIANAISVVVYLEVDREERKRRLASVFEVEGSADGAIQLSPIFSYDRSRCRKTGLAQWQRDSGISRFAKLLAEAGVSLPAPRTTLTLEPEDLYGEAFCASGGAAGA